MKGKKLRTASPSETSGPKTISFLLSSLSDLSDHLQILSSFDSRNRTYSALFPTEVKSNLKNLNRSQTNWKENRRRTSGVIR